jgi:hypothetical protein
MNTLWTSDRPVNGVLPAAYSHRLAAEWGNAIW